MTHARCRAGGHPGVPLTVDCDISDIGAVPLADVAAVVLCCACRTPHTQYVPGAQEPLPAILRVALERLGLHAPRSMRREPNGRPYLAYSDGRRWKVDFNISHSDDLLGVAVGAGGGRLGLDVQGLPRSGWERIIRRWLHPEERRRIEALAPADAHREFTRVWAVREARCKATGQGLAGFRSSSAVADGAFGLLDGVSWRELPLPDNYAGALAWAGPPEQNWLGRPVVVAHTGSVSARREPVPAMRYGMSRRED